MYDHNTRPSQTDRQTDEHRGNGATIRSMNASRAKNLSTSLYVSTTAQYTE